jgi:hypothetical protein
VIINTKAVFLIEEQLPWRARLLVLLGGYVTVMRLDSGDGYSHAHLNVNIPDWLPSWLKARPWWTTWANLPTEKDA